MNKNPQQIDFFSMLQEMEQEEISKTNENKAVEVKKEEKKAIEPVKDKKPAGTKKTAKNIHFSFEKQYEDATNEQKKVIDHIKSLPGMKEKLENENVSIEKMWKYIVSQAPKIALEQRKSRVSASQSVCIDDDIVYGWGTHYYDELGKVDD